MRLFGQRWGSAGAMLLAALVLIALAAPWLAPYDPQALDAAPFARPSLSHPLGANDIGQDILSQLIYGTRTSLGVGMAAGLLATVIGLAAGLFAGLAGGGADFALMRAVDVLLALPFLPLMIVLSVFLGPRVESEVLIMAAVMWPRTARILRSQVLAVSERGHVQTARVMGAGIGHLLVRHVLPLVFPLVVPELVRAAGNAITLDASLGFLGLGDRLQIGWGSIIFSANTRSAFLTDAWLWWVVPPGLAIGVTVLSFGLIGFGLEERARPRLRHGAPGGGTARAARGMQPHEAAFHEGELLRLENLEVDHQSSDGVVPAVRGVNLTIRPGEVVGLVGPSGCGKTTLVTGIFQLHGSASVVRGATRFRGQDLRAADDTALRHLRGKEMALVPQHSMNALNPVHRVVRQVAEAIEVHRRPGLFRRRASKADARRRALALLASVGLPEDRAEAYPHELSGGMRQRVVLAMALANQPRLLVADEPTNGLDVLLQVEMVRLLRSVRERAGVAMLVVSHDVPAIAMLADRLVVMDEGRFVEDGPALRVMSAPGSASARRLIDGLPCLTGLMPGGPAAPGVGPATAARSGGAGPTHEVLRFERVTKVYGGQRRSGRVEAVHDLSFGLSPGEWLGLIGPSGAGKTTIAQLAVALALPTEGEVARGDAAPGMPFAHLILQDPYDSLPPAMRVFEMVAEPLRICRVPRTEWGGRVDGALAGVTLDPRRYRTRLAHELSGGERQRVALARALILPPRLVVADEATSLLDASCRLELLRLMKRLTGAASVACLCITHDLALACGVCDRVLVVDRGRLVDAGAPARLLQSPGHPATAALAAATHLIR